MGEADNYCCAPLVIVLSTPLTFAHSIRQIKHPESFIENPNEDIFLLWFS